MPYDLAVARDEVNRKHRLCRMYTSSFMETAVDVGYELADIKATLKATVGHGHWLEWLGTTEVSERQAQKYMKAAKNAPEGGFADGTTLNGFRDTLARKRKGDTDDDDQTDDDADDDQSDGDDAGDDDQTGEETEPEPEPEPHDGEVLIEDIEVQTEAEIRELWNVADLLTEVERLRRTGRELPRAIPSHAGDDLLARINEVRQWHRASDRYWKKLVDDLMERRKETGQLSIDDASLKAA